MQPAYAVDDALPHRIEQLIRARGLDLHAWYARDTIETLVWYTCRDADLATRLRITRDAKLAAAAGLVRDCLSDEEYAGLIDALPENVHGIFMRRARPQLHRSR